jgi:Transposase IS66 family
MSEITGRLPEGSPAVLYRYSPDRKSEHPRAHLRDSRGILQADGYAGYAGLYGNRVVEGACMAHARRKFFDVHEATKSPLACEALDRIAALYRIEAQILAWFRICRFRVTRARRNRRPVRAGFQLESCPAREAVSLPGSRLLGLKWPEAQQRQPMRMALAGHQFPRAFAIALGTAAAYQATMVQEELKQVQV